MYADSALDNEEVQQTRTIADRSKKREKKRVEFIINHLNIIMCRKGNAIKLIHQTFLRKISDTMNFACLLSIFKQTIAAPRTSRSAMLTI